jgi:hypothetical protein
MTPKSPSETSDAPMGHRTLIWGIYPHTVMQCAKEGKEDNPMKLLEMLSKPAAWASGWTSAVLCFSAATGYWLAGERGRAIVWVVLGAVEVLAIVL